MLINDILITNTKDEQIELVRDYAYIEPSMCDNIISDKISCRISFDIKIDDNLYLGKVFLESIQVEKYIAVFIRLYKFDKNIVKRVLNILERETKTELICVPTDINNISHHQLLEDMGYIHIKDYIYPDIKLYCKEMK